MLNSDTSLAAIDVREILKKLNSTAGDFFTKPDNDKPLFEKVTAHSIKIPSGFTDRTGDSIIQTTSDYILDLDTDLDTGTKTPGTDYYVYAKADNTFYISANKEITADKLIGGFHYGLTAEDEALTGNKTEADMVSIRGINKYSFWDLKFRPVANPEGMVLIGNKWYDIYLLNSEHIVNGTSKANLTIAGGSTSYGRAIPKIPLEYSGDGVVDYGKFTWFQACEIAKSHSKELISYMEFPTIAYGVLEKASAEKSGYEVVVGKIEHYPELTSKYGIEQATGTQWIFGKDVGGNRDEGSTSWAWETSITDNRGSIYEANSNHITVASFGLETLSDVYAGSRGSAWNLTIWNTYWSIGARFACSHLRLV